MRTGCDLQSLKYLLSVPFRKSLLILVLDGLTHHCADL